MGVSRSPHRAGDYFPVWNAKSYADRRGDGCPSAPAMQHSGAGHGTVSSVVSHDPLRSKHKSGSVGVVDQTVAPGADQTRGNAQRRRARRFSFAAQAATQDLLGIS